MNLTAAFYNRLSGDGELTALLAAYGGGPAIFTTDPGPGNAVLPYIVTAGEVLAEPFDTKTTLGRRVWRDVRCYAPATGSAQTIEQIAERVRELFHRHELEVDGYETWISEVSGPRAIDEEDAYGRLLTVKLTLQEETES